MELSIGIAFAAGLASFVSPCVLSLVPVYLAYLTGRSVSLNGFEAKKPSYLSLLHGALFVLGFSVVFIALGMAFSTLGSLLYDARDVIAKIGGLVVILFGLHILGILRIPFLEYDLRPRNNMEKNRGFISSLLLGVFFSAGWSPCVGPVLGVILVIAMNQGQIMNGVWLLTAYSLGMAVPFLMAAAAIDRFLPLIRRYRKTLRGVEIATGILMVAVGILLFFGVFESLSRFGSFIHVGG